ncbi:MAG: iron export ABC transporter permease subunit FetB [Fimbriimonadaceae bacterium]|nr:iron export ABC transporter permease subunit FetB [Alphaproteobacteria bacterium]
MTYLTLELTDLAIAAGLILLNGAISIAFSLGIARTLFIAAIRMGVQLGAIGFALKFIFEQSSPFWTAALVLVMLAVAGREVLARQKFRFRGWWSYAVGAGALTVASLSVAIFALTAVIGPDPWYLPRYVLPILGMILGNTMTAVALGLDTLMVTGRRERAGIEAQLAQGMTWKVASRPLMNEALRTAMMPIINAMAASGIVSLPGMMTGQILAGVDPVEAVKYQIVIMFLIAGATALGALIAVMTANRLLTDSRERLRLDRVQ